MSTINFNRYVNKLASIQKDDLLKKGYIILNGIYSQELQLKGTKTKCFEFIQANKQLENNYDHFLVWKFKNVFYLTLGTC